MTSDNDSSKSTSHHESTSPTASVAGDAVLIKIILWNLWLLPSILTDRHSRSRALAISPLLNAYDIVVLNEGFSNKKALLSQTTHAHRYIPPCPKGRFVDSGLIFLSKYGIVDSGYERYERVAGIDRFAGKGIGFVTVRLEGQGMLQVFGTHMQAGASKGIHAARGAQAVQAGKFVVRHKNEKAVTVLAGDLNMGPRLDADCEEHSVHYVDQEDAKARCTAYEELVKCAALGEVDCEQEWEYERDICRFLVCGLERGEYNALASYEDLAGPGPRRLSDTKPICLTLTLRKGSEAEDSK